MLERIRFLPVYHVPLLLALVLSAFAPFAHAATDPYLRIAEGDSRARVVGLLGEPADPRRDLSTADRKYIKKTLKVIDSKDAVDFAVWKQGSHLYYLIGFNKQGTVSTKNRIIGLSGGR
jgi:hypothetical protein